MRAIAYHRYGPPDVLQCEEIDQPAAGGNEVLIKVCAASVNAVERYLMRGTPYIGRLALGVIKPKDTWLGRDVAGVVEATGRNVTQFKPGDAVFGTCSGAFAEYACVSEQTLVMKPSNVTFEQAASAPLAAITSLQALRDKGRIQRGQKVLINGASGGVGTFAVQIAKSLGADVTGVCSTKNMDLVRAIGADRVIDYTQEDFTKEGQRYDLLFDFVGNHSLSACRTVLNPGGTCILSGGSKGRWVGPLARGVRALVLSRFVSQNFVMFLANVNQADLRIVSELMASGHVKPVIDRRYPLTDAPEALRYLEQGHARGKVLITLE